MAKWQIATVCVNISKKMNILGGTYPEPSVMWNKNPKIGKSDFDILQEWAAAGWELVSVTPIQANSAQGGGAGTFMLLYSFKKPIEEGS
jgi:hypothetical protein